MKIPEKRLCSLFDQYNPFRVFIKNKNSMEKRRIKENPEITLV